MITASDVDDALRKCGSVDLASVSRDELATALNKAGFKRPRSEPGQEAQAPQAALSPQVPLQTLRSPATACVSCQGPLYDYGQKETTARVLDVDGWATATHVPRRCRNRSCARLDKRVWHNFITESRGERMWLWPPNVELTTFVLAPSWGVTCRWLRQFTQRIIRHFASFDGEARVHEATAVRNGTPEVVPEKARHKVRIAWLTWRVVVRTFQKESDEGDPNPASSINIALPPERLAQGIAAWYQPAMLKRRVGQVHASGQQCDKVVIDGNAKLTRRSCGRECASLMFSEQLNMYTATKCAETPAWKSRFCCKHPPNDPVDRGPPQSEVIVAHRRLRRPTGTESEPYQVCLKDAASVDNPWVQHRWCAADLVTRAQLIDYWGARYGQQVAEAPVSSGAAPVRARPLVYEPLASGRNAIGATSCKTHKESTIARTQASRRSGWLFACTSGGFVIHVKEFVGAESLTQRYFFLPEMKQVAPELAVVVHDDACHLRKYADARRHTSDAAAALAFPRVQYVIDHMHFKNHVDPWCRANCGPDVDANVALLQGINTPACEQLCSWWPPQAVCTPDAAFHGHALYQRNGGRAQPGEARSH